MTGIGRLDAVVFDAPDVDTLAAFYTALTGWPVARTEPSRVTLQTPAGPGLAVQHAPDHVAPRWPGQEYPQQVHLDLDVDDVHQAAQRAVGLGATRLAEGPYWVTLGDPAGHPVDLCTAGDVTAMSRLWISIDAPDPSALAGFYAVLLGMPITHDQPEGAAVACEGTTVFLQHVPGYRPPQWPNPRLPQQAHLDVHVDDLDRSEAQAVDLGASPLRRGDGFRVLADPVGHPFCLTR